MSLARHIYRRLLSYLVGMLLIGIAIGSHEAAHWIAARGCGIYCASLNIGVGPGVKVGSVDETAIILRALPWGGWVSVAHKPSDIKSSTTTKQSFVEQPKAERLLVSFAGIAMNGVMYLGLVFWHRRSRSITMNDLQKEESIAWSLAEVEADFRSTILQRLADGPASAIQFLSRGGMFGLAAIRDDLTRVCSGLAVINLIPIAPLDGLKILQAVTIESVTTTPLASAVAAASKSGIATTAATAVTTRATPVVSLETLIALGVCAYVVLGIVPALIRTIRFEWILHRRFKLIPRP